MKFLQQYPASSLAWPNVVDCCACGEQTNGFYALDPNDPFWGDSDAAMPDIELPLCSACHQIEDRTVLRRMVEGRVP